MSPPRWLADEMVGRLARYLRLVGCDTVYAKGLDDREILVRAAQESRVILTRDRQLARRATRALLLTLPDIAGQWRAVRAAYPDVPDRVQPSRCTECNAPLHQVPPPVAHGPGSNVPWDRVDRGLALYRCEACEHLYWEGSHTAAINARLAAWAEEPAPP